ncbi:Uncharacterized protein SCF082_LOCUS29186, partial [Durusdinium trenchii]
MPAISLSSAQKLSTPLWLGPSYAQPAGSNFVTLREEAVLFDAATSYESSSHARPGDIFLTGGPVVVVDGYAMLPVDCGALESKFVRLAYSTEFMCPKNLAVLDLDSAPVRSAIRRVKHRQGQSLWKLWISSLRCKCQQINEPHAPHSSSCPVSDPLNHETRTFLSLLNVSAVTSMTSSHCWWFASSFHTGVPALHLMLRAVDFAQAVLGWNLDAAWSLLSAATSDHQIRILVTALSCHYPHGLLIAHNPSKGAFLFLPQSAPFFVSYATALKWAKVFPATSPDQVRSILDSLGLYESTTGHFQWQKAAKLFDDWNLVVQGPICEQYWQLHGAPLCPEADRNPHAFCLCFNCGVAARWGPCEHAYSLMLHQNTIDVVQLPRPRPKGRPKTRSQHCPPGGTLTPGPAVSRASPATPLSADVLQSQALSASESVLRELLRRAGCGHYFPAMKRHGATVQALSSFGFADFVTIFGMKVSEAHILMSTLKDE